MEPEAHETTKILSQAVDGNPAAADELIGRVYTELRHVAANYLRGERRDHTLQPTALVHEAYVRLVDPSRVDWHGKTHFLAIAAREMRRVLIHHARAHHAQKRGGGRVKVILDPAVLPLPEAEVDALDLLDGLEKLAESYPRPAKVTELRFFSGLAVKETALNLGVSQSAVEKDWRFARAWLHRYLKRAASGKDGVVDC